MQPELAGDQVDDVRVGAAVVIGCHEVVADDEGERESAARKGTATRHALP